MQIHHPQGGRGWLTTLHRLPMGTFHLGGGWRVFLLSIIDLCERVDQLPLFPYNRGMVINPIVGVYIPSIRIPY